MKKRLYSHKKNKIFQYKILDSREKTYNIINNFINEKIIKDNLTLICITFNIKGLPKIIFQSISALRVLLRFYEKFYGYKSIKYTKFMNSFSGLILLIAIEGSPPSLKYMSYNIEKENRFFDIDVFYKKNYISSNLLGLSPKKCILCDEVANICIYKKTHTIRQVRKKVIFEIKRFNKIFNEEI